MDRREEYKIEFVRSFVRLVVLVLLTATIIRGDSSMPIWLGVRAAVLIEYISFSLKDGIKELVKNFLAHIFTGAVLAIGWYGAYVLFELKNRFFWENGTVLHVTVPECIKQCAIISAIGLTICAVMYTLSGKRKTDFDMERV
ncbi:hypothetical protein [Ruminococcus albus]|uniref:Uncharacterized protein n=1 Tax=Ruminococcus albus TaxID=1264 RepID=A0A1I1LKH2_RUMAL|nr:hypothetical protein [Ruminococcus albus]SFC73697.1 hypothetical protein SAMN02910406_02285 [Ruminococcus albus]